MLAWGFEKDDLGILGSDKVPGVQGSVIWICLLHAWGFRVTIFECTEQSEYVLHAGLPELDPMLPYKDMGLPWIGVHLGLEALNGR